MAKKTNYTVVFKVKHDGKLYKPGDTVQMDPEQAEPLLRRGTLKDGPNAPEPNPDMAPPVIGETKPLENSATDKQLTSDPAEVK